VTTWRESVEHLLELQRALVVEWHARGDDHSEAPTGIDRLVEDQHRCNFRIWHLEDVARDPQASDAEIASVKRSIDRLNQERNDLIEQIDLELLSALRANEEWNDDAPLNSETAGSILDRCSIMALKTYHMAEEATRDSASADHRALASERVALLHEQRDDLGTCLIDLLDQSASGERRFQVYRQLKMYNDPTLNPRIYGTADE
jgi:hypothetical protein